MTILGPCHLSRRWSEVDVRIHVALSLTRIRMLTLIKWNAAFPAWIKLLIIPSFWSSKSAFIDTDFPWHVSSHKVDAASKFEVDRCKRFQSASFDSNWTMAMLSQNTAAKFRRWSTLRTVFSARNWNNLALEKFLKPQEILVFTPFGTGHEVDFETSSARKKFLVQNS